MRAAADHRAPTLPPARAAGLLDGRLAGTPHAPLALPAARPLTLRAPLCGAGQAYGALLLAGLCGDSALAHGTAGLAAPDGALVVAALR